MRDPLPEADDRARLTVRVVGVGNRERGDDAAGLVAVRLLRRLLRPLPEGLSFLVGDGDPGRLLDVFDGADAVVVVDAMAGGGAPGALLRLDARTEPVPASLRATSTHGIGLGAAIELARALGRLPRRVVVWAVEGERFERGAGLSDPVRDGIADLVSRLRSELEGAGEA